MREIYDLKKIQTKSHRKEKAKMAAKLDVMFTTAFVVLMLGQIDFVKGEASVY